MGKILIILSGILGFNSGSATNQRYDLETPLFLGLISSCKAKEMDHLSLSSLHPLCG